MSKNFIDGLPEKFVRNTLDLCGEWGKQWLNDLPEVIREIEKSWSLKTEKAFENMSYNYVAPCICADGSKAVIKIALPLNNLEIFNEAKFLRLSNGNGSVKLLRSDENRRAILLEKLTPGANLKEICRKDEAEAIEIAIPVMRKLLKEPPVNYNFLRLEDWYNNFFEKADETNFPSEVLNKARKYFIELSSASKQKFLIHGDFHHENVLSATREAFLAIDPKGIIGDIGYEIAVFLNNHLWWLACEANLKEKLNDALRHFSEAFEIETLDLRKWAFAQIVLSAWWTFDENGENWETELAFAEFWEV